MSSDFAPEGYRSSETGAALLLLAGMGAGALLVVYGSTVMVQALGVLLLASGSAGFLHLRRILQERYSELWSGVDE